jgi:hypothetical protein
VQRYFTKKKYTEVKGVNKQTEQISVLVSICTQEFQLTPEFLFEKIDQGRFQHLCKIRFQGILISEGKGHNKGESKKDASVNAIKVVAPNIFKELFAEHSSNVAEENIPKEPPHKKAAEEEQKSSPLKLVGQKRVEAPQVLVQDKLQKNSQQLDESNEGILAADLATGINDGDVKLHSPEILNRKTLFKKYTPFTLLQLIAKHSSFKIFNGMKQTRSSNPQETIMY